MRLLISVFLCCLFVFYGAQLRTQLRPAYPALRRIKRRAVLFGGQRWLVRVEVMRMI